MPTPDANDRRICRPIEYADQDVMFMDLYISDARVLATVSTADDDSTAGLAPPSAPVPDAADDLPERSVKIPDRATQA